MPSNVLCDVVDGVAVVTLHDPDRRNAINATMNAELLALFDDLEGDDDVHAAVLTGTPPAFCAGADLGALRDATDAAQLRAIYQGFLRVANTSLPTVAAVNGAAVGAGVNMALACDVIVTAESARIESRFLKIGLHPGGGHMWRLARLAGDRAVRAMVLFGETLDGRRAADVGLAWRCVPDGELLATAVQLARGASDAPKALVARTKDTISRLATASSADDAVTLEIEPQTWSAGQPEFQELLAKLRARIEGGTPR
jgi:enoyl-CoA hydratase